MKLYTEEQVKQMYETGGLDALKHINCDESYLSKLQSLTPIELPSDEEIIKESIKHSRPQIFINGAEYIKKQINKK